MIKKCTSGCCVVKAETTVVHIYYEGWSGNGLSGGASWEDMRRERPLYPSTSTIIYLYTVRTYRTDTVFSNTVAVDLLGHEGKWFQEFIQGSVLSFQLLKNSPKNNPASEK